MGCHFLLQEIFPNPAIQPASPVSPALQAGTLPRSHPRPCFGEVTLYNYWKTLNVSTLDLVSFAFPKLIWPLNAFLKEHLLTWGTGFYRTHFGGHGSKWLDRLFFLTVLCLVAQSCLTLCNPMDCSLPGSSVYRDSLGKNTGVGCQALLQGSYWLWSNYYRRLLPKIIFI